MRDRLISSVTSFCKSGGLDIVHPCSIDDKLAILVGNTKALWPHFLAAYDKTSEHPLDDYVIEVLKTAIAAFDGCEVVFAHSKPFIPIQKIAHDAGLAYLSKSNLCIHPVYGPWFALRAIIHTSEKGCETTPIVNPCTDCRCDELLECAQEVPADWTRWLAVRDECPVGRSYRYSEEQIGYHYIKDRKFLNGM